MMQLLSQPSVLPILGRFCKLRSASAASNPLALLLRLVSLACLAKTLELGPPLELETPPRKTEGA